MGLMAAYFSPMFGHEFPRHSLSPTPGWFYVILAVVGAWLCLLLGMAWQAQRGHARTKGAPRVRYSPRHRRPRRSSPMVPWPQSGIKRGWARLRAPHHGPAPLMRFPPAPRPPSTPRAFPHRR